MIYTLFSDDIREICFPATADVAFSDITLFCMAYYTLEIIVFSIFTVTCFSFRKITSLSITSGLISSALSPCASISYGSPSISQEVGRVRLVSLGFRGRRELRGWEPGLWGWFGWWGWSRFWSRWSRFLRTLLRLRNLSQHQRRCLRDYHPSTLN